MKINNSETGQINAAILAPIECPKASAYTTVLPKAQADVDAGSEFGRWRDVERLFGIKRGTLYSLIAEGKIKSISMRRKGNKFGCRLIHLASVRAYLHSLLEIQNPQQSQSTN